MSNPSRELWLIRHGETDWNTRHRVQGSTDTQVNANAPIVGSANPYPARRTRARRGTWRALGFLMGLWLVALASAQGTGAVRPQRF